MLRRITVGGAEAREVAEFWERETCRRGGLCGAQRHTRAGERRSTAPLLADSRSRGVARDSPPVLVPYAALAVFASVGSPISSLRIFSSTFIIGIVIVRTPSCIAAFANSGFTPSGSGSAR